MLLQSEEQIMLRDSARSMLTERAPVSHLRALRDANDSQGFSRALWTEMAEMGWAGIAVPEEQGGIGFGLSGLGVILEETGRTLTPCPLFSTGLLGASALTLGGSAEQQQRLLPGVVDGSQLLALASEERSRHQPAHVETTAESQDGGYVLNGRKCQVIDGHAADWLVVSARDGESVGLFLVAADAPGVTIEAHRHLDSHFGSVVHLDQVRVESSDRLPGDGAAILERLMDLGRIGQAAELLGIARTVFDLTLDYLRNRKQFGVTIASFQALQHRAAHLYAEIELLTSTVTKALQVADDPDHPELALHASLAKAKASSVAALVCQEGIQMHGGIGMTDEYDLGFYIKRARALQQTLGDEYFHLDRFAKLNGY